MKSLFQHTFAYFTALLIVAATGGISFFQHYCSCHDELQSSLFTETIQCHQDNDQVCCENEGIKGNASCCSTDQPTNDKPHHDHTGHACCSTVYSYYKTDQVNLKEPVHVPQNFSSSFVTIISEPQTDQKHFTTSLKLWDSHPPAIPYGSDLLSFLQQRKLDAPPC